MTHSSNRSSTPGWSARAMLPVLAVLAVLGPAGAWAKADMRRCDDGAGHVTYSNESCPTGTTSERNVEDRPPVEVPGDGAADKGGRSGKVTGIVPSNVPANPGTPERAEEAAREQRKSRLARCDDLVRRIEYAQQDLLSAAPGERASFELGVRRLQEEHAANCTAP
jgi:hypothetical protein